MAHPFEFCNSSRGLCDCGLPSEHPDHEQQQPIKANYANLNEDGSITIHGATGARVDRPPHYSFKDIKGVMSDGMEFKAQVNADRVDVEFTYIDQYEGKTYRVVAVGRRTEVLRDE